MKREFYVPTVLLVKHKRLPRKYMVNKQINPLLFITTNMEQISTDCYIIIKSSKIIILDSRRLKYIEMKLYADADIEYTVLDSEIGFTVKQHDLSDYTWNEKITFSLTDKGKYIGIVDGKRANMVDFGLRIKVAGCIALLAWLLYAMVPAMIGVMEIC